MQRALTAGKVKTVLGLRQCLRKYVGLADLFVSESEFHSLIRSCHGTPQKDGAVAKQPTSDRMRAVDHAVLEDADGVRRRQASGCASHTSERKRPARRSETALLLINEVFPDGAPDELGNKVIFNAIKNWVSQKHVTCPSMSAVLRVPRRKSY